MSQSRTELRSWLVLQMHVENRPTSKCTWRARLKEIASCAPRVGACEAAWKITERPERYGLVPGRR